MSTRKFSRVRFRVIATATAGGRSFQGRVTDLSMNGVFLETQERLPEGELTDIVVTLEGSDPQIILGFEGRVCRVTDDGIGFKFERIDFDSYTHLKNIITYNIADSNKVMDEIYTDIEEKLSSSNP